jgi:hypothetical protein
VFTPDLRNQRSSLRLVGLGLLLFVFFLPLHFHFSVASQISKECSCAHGTRKQLALSEVGPTNSPQFRAIPLVVPSTSVWIESYSKPQNVRAPPSTVSL